MLMSLGEFTIVNTLFVLASCSFFMLCNVGSVYYRCSLFFLKYNKVDMSQKVELNVIIILLLPVGVQECKRHQHRSADDWLTLDFPQPWAELH